MNNIAQELESIIVGMIERGCVHRNGMVLGRCTSREIVEALQREVNELEEACYTEPENVLEEAADVLGVLVHLIRAYGFTMAQVEQQEIKKLQERFTEPE